jgi:glutamine amidotransferase
VAIVATEPLTAGEPWQAMAPGELRVFVRGEHVACPHAAPKAPQ